MRNAPSESGSIKQQPRKRDTRTAISRLCQALGAGLKVGDELRFDIAEQPFRGQDYWIGFALVNHVGEKCGEVSAGYVSYIADVRIYASIIINGEIVGSESVTPGRMSRYDHQKNEQPKELKVLLIKVVTRATRNRTLS